MLMRSALSGGGWRLSRRLALCLAIVALPIIVAPSAMATEPMRSTIQLSLHFDPWNLCPAYDFHIVGDFDITRDTITFYNEEGNAVRMIQVNTLVGTLANSVTGYSLPTNGLRVNHYDFTEGTLFATGVNLVTQLPDGDGASMLGVGRIVFSSPTGTIVEHDGPDSPSELAQLCDALA